MNKVIAFPIRSSIERAPVRQLAAGEPRDHGFRQIKRFCNPAEGNIFSVLSDDFEAHIYRSRDSGVAWELALVTSLKNYRAWTSGFSVNHPDCEDTLSFFEMVQFLQSGDVLPNGDPVPNYQDPARKWNEIQRSGAKIATSRREHR
jgi:hypothetical protein